MRSYLYQVEEVVEVGPKKVGYPLICVHLTCQRLQLRIPPHLHCDLPNVVHNDQPLDPLEGGVYPREVAGEHVMLVPEEVSVYHQCGGARHGQGRFVIASILDQGNEKIVGDGTTINL